MCGVSACCSDDVDDQYTEKGRQLIRKEGEALAAGMRIGEVLAAGDLELPGVPPRKKPGGLLLLRVPYAAVLVRWSSWCEQYVFSYPKTL